MVNIDNDKNRKTIVKYTLFANLILLGFGIFYKSNFSVTITVFNIGMMGIYLLLVKYEYLVIGMVGANKLANKIDKYIGGC